MIKKFFFATLLIAIIPNLSKADDNFKRGISIFGDLKYGANFKHFEYVNPSAKKGGLVKMGAEGTFNSLNPFILKGISASGIDYLYDSLMEGSDDEISSRYGLVAESVMIAPDKYSMTFRLNKNARFHDDRPITADDVIFTFKTLVEKGHPSYKIAYRDVKDVIKINNHEVKFLFTTNKNKDLPLLVSSLKILPKHYYENHKFDETSMQPPLGSGPYKIKEVKQGKTVVYERVKNYWAKDLPINVGRYNFDLIQYDYYLDSNVLIEAFKAGQFDIRQENVARNWANSYNIDKVKNGEIIKQEIEHNLPAGTQTFILNLRREKFRDIELRKAMTYAFNFEWLKKHIFYNSYKRTESYFANSEFAYNYDAKDKFKLPISQENNFGRQNLIIAKDLLDKAGYKIKDGKLIDPKTQKPINIEFLIASKSFEMIIAPFVDNLQKLGISATIKFVEENQYDSRVRNFDYDVIVAVFSPSLIPGSELFRYWHSSQKDTIGSQNYSGLVDKKTDIFVEKIAKTQNKDELIALCREFDRHMLENYYTIPQWHNNSHRILHKNNLRRPKISPKYSLAFDSWWIE